MTTFDALSVGDIFMTPARALDADTVAALVSLGGYTHPLFTDPAFAAASPFGRSPVPGQALLLLMGGLVEQTDRFDDTTIALAGFEAVRFIAPAFGGDTIHVDVEIRAKEQHTHRNTIDFLWRCLNDRDELLVDLTARMIFRPSTASGVNRAGTT